MQHFSLSTSKIKLIESKCIIVDPENQYYKLFCDSSIPILPNITSNLYISQLCYTAIKIQL